MKNRLFVMLALLGILMFSCSSETQNNSQSEYDVDFDTTSMKQSELWQHNEAPKLKVAVSAMISPKETFEYYKTLLGYVANKLKMQLVFKQRKTYKEVNDLIGRKELDMAFICSGAYVAAEKKIPVEILAVPVVSGEPLYNAYIIVNKESGIKTFEELKGKKFAFTDPLSNTGHHYVEYLLKKRKTTPEKYFSKIIFTYAHDYSIQAVSRGLVDGATVDGLIYNYLKAAKPDKVANTQIIQQSEKFGIPPVVVNKNMDERLKQQIKNVLLTLHQDSTGIRILRGIHIDKFVEVNTDHYNSVRQLQAVINK